MATLYSSTLSFLGNSLSDLEFQHWETRIDPVDWGLIGHRVQTRKGPGIARRGGGVVSEQARVRAWSRPVTDYVHIDTVNLCRPNTQFSP